MRQSTPFQTIRNEIINDPSNAVFRKEGQVPVYMADAKAKILIIGQAPGAVAAEKGIPFDDKSGDHLREWLGIDRETFYHSGLFAVLPMDFFFNGKGEHGDNPPRKDFAEKWHPKLIALMPDIQLTLLLGSYSAKAYLHGDSHFKLTDAVENFRQYLPKYFPLIHPSPRNNIWIAEHPWFTRDVIPALRQLVHHILDEQ